MSRVIGFAITGLAVYLAINSLPDLNTRSEHDTAVAIATDNREGMARDVTQIASAGRSFSASNPLSARPSSKPLETIAPKGQTPARRTSLAVSDVQTVRAAERVKENGASQQLAANDATPALQPVIIKAVMVNPPKPENLVLETQRELKRVGCYRGRIDGKWGRGSRKALRKFVKRSRILTSANGKYKYVAVKPAPGVLGALRKTSRKICGRPCASGKMLSSNGRCIKDPVIMASLDVQNTALQPAKVSKIDRSAKTKKITARVLYLKKPGAKRKWRRNRYALGGPRYKKRRFSRRYSRRHYIRRRKNAWIREAFGE